MKQRKEDNRRRDSDVTGAEPLAGSGFEREEPESDFNGNAEESAESERGDDK